jgi:hypothetical protein
MHASRIARIVGGSALALAALVAAAQNRPPTAEQIGRDPGALRQEAEQKRALEQQQQQQRSQQEADQQWNDALRRQQSQANSDMAQGEQVRRTWQQRPPLAPEKNPLLGRWESLGVGQQRQGAPGVSPEMAQLANALLGGLTGGLCDSMLGKGTIEFRPTGVVAIGPDGRERPMYRAEYRGGGSRVVVLPQGGTTFTHMIIDFSGSDRASVAVVGCALTRSGPPAAAAKGAMTETALATGNSGAAAQQWTLLGTLSNNGGMDVYVSAASIRRAGDKARMFNLIDFKTRQSFDGKSYLSARNELEFDCAKALKRMLNSTGYSGHMGTGTVVVSDTPSDPWQAVGSSGPGFEHWKVACKQR